MRVIVDMGTATPCEAMAIAQTPFEPGSGPAAYVAQ